MADEDIIVIDTVPTTTQVEVVTDPEGVTYVDTLPAASSVIEFYTQPVAELQVETGGPRGVQGDEGPQGPPGDPTLGATKEYYFPTPLYVWEGEHPYLGRPTVILIDDEDGSPFLGRITYPQRRSSVDDPQMGLVVAIFSVPMAGTLVIRA